MDTCDCLGCRREGDTRRDRMLPDRALHRWQNGQHRWADSDNALNALKERIRGCRGDLENHAVQVAIGWHGLQADPAPRQALGDTIQRVEPNIDIEVPPVLGLAVPAAAGRSLGGAEGADGAGESSAQAEGETTPDHDDFLDRAVAAAIRRKGLSVLACSDFG